MHVTLLGIPSAVGVELEQALQGAKGPVQVQRFASLHQLPALLPPGLVVAWEPGGELEQARAWCQQLHERRLALRSHLVVLTERGPEEAEALVRAGADECLALPGGPWRARLLALERRLAEAEAASTLPPSPRGVRPEEALQSLLSSTTHSLGLDFFRSLVAHLARAFRVSCVVVGELLPQRDEVRTLAFWLNGELQPNTSYKLSGTPCQGAVANAVCHYREGVASSFPEDEMLSQLGLQGYLGVALKNSRDQVVGVLALLHSERLEAGPVEYALLGMLGLYAGTELERMRAQAERQRLEAQLRLADRMASLGTLAAGVVHELNNPLAYVCSNVGFLSQQLARAELAPGEWQELREVVAEVEEGVGRMRSILQDLKTLARTDEEPQHGALNVHEALEGALKLVRSELRHSAQVVRDLEPVPAVRGHAGRLGQVLVNLLVNALQAFPERRPERNRIRLATRRAASEWVVLEVEDNGPGMQPQVLEHLFNPFFTTKPLGTGLGLSICHSIVESMGGRIEVESAPGRGSLFRLRLPVAAALS